MSNLKTPPNVWHNSRNYNSTTSPADTDVSSDPLYSDYIERDLTLQSDSPCKILSSTGGEIGAYGNGGNPPLTDRTYSTEPTTSGSLIANENWSGTVYLIGNVTVPRPYFLKIDAGTTIRVAKGVHLTVESIFFAQGTASSPIVFIWETEEEHWGNLTFSGSPGSIFDHGRVIGSRGLVIQSGMTVSNSVIRDSLYNGMSVYYASPTIRNNLIEQNMGSGILIPVSSSPSPLIENNLIIDNEDDGIMISDDNSRPLIRFNTIDSNGGAGIVFGRCDSGTAAENNIITNNTDGFSGADSKDAQTGYNNVWHNSRNYNSTTSPADTDVSSDPLYSDYTDRNLTLQSGSPCKTLSSTGGEIGAYGNGGNPPLTDRAYSNDPTVSGTLVRNEHWSGTVHLTGNVTVPRPYVLNPSLSLFVTNML